MEITQGQAPDAADAAAPHRWRPRALALVLALASACHSAGPVLPAPRPLAAQRIANLRAFARLYGVVRWFHPSDAAAAVDWDRFAIDGVRRVLDVPGAS